jgi:hypothetical protein
MGKTTCEDVNDNEVPFSSVSLRRMKGKEQLVELKKSTKKIYLCSPSRFLFTSRPACRRQEVAGSSKW